MELEYLYRRSTVPNTLTQLNTFSNSELTYQDQRPFTIVFDPATPASANVAVDEDIAFRSPVGTNIVELYSAPESAAGFVTYNINLTAFGNRASLNWPSPLPPGLAVLNPGGNVYSLTGYLSPEKWDTIKNPEIIIKDQGTNFSYTANIQYPDPANVANVAVKTWTVNAIVTGSDELSNATAWSYVKNETGTIAGAPQIIDPTVGSDIYTITVTPSTTIPVNILSVLGTGGNVSFDAVSKILTISGTKTEVNNRLSQIRFTPTSDSIQSLTLAYTLTNPITNLITTRTQNVTAVGAAFNISRTSYGEDVAASLAYSVVDQSATATNFSISVAQTTPNPSTAGGYFHLNGSNVGNTVAWSGTRTQVNTANVWYFPPIDWTGNIVLTINQSKVDNGNTVIQHTNETWLLTNSATNTEIVNMIDRSYTSKTVNNIFSGSTPGISDGPDVGQTYTITLSSSLGKFGNSVANAIASASYSFTGNMSQVNNQFQSMVFIPPLGSQGQSGTFNYKQFRNNTLQLDITRNLIGTPGPSSFNYVFFTPGTQTWTPSQNDLLFGNVVNVDIVGAGGGGGGGAGQNVNLNRIGGGGGGGQVQTLYNVQLSNTPYTFTIGSGGLGGVNATGGGSTTAFGVTCQGGGPGFSGNTSPATDSRGGTSGSGFAGGLGGVINNVGAGGGGGGAGGIGKNLSPTVRKVAQGGPGVVGGAAPEFTWAQGGDGFEFLPNSPIQWSGGQDGGTGEGGQAGYTSLVNGGRGGSGLVYIRIT